MTSYRDEQEQDFAHFLEMRDVTPEARAQVAEASADLDVDPSDIVRWPYPELDAVTGPLGSGGDIWIIGAASGGGKTTFVASTIERWRAQGLRIYVMPLETQPKRFRTYLACMSLGIPPGDALSKRLRFMPDGEAKRMSIKAALDEQFKPPFVEQVYVDACTAIDVAGLTAGFGRAAAWGANVVIVDHIDHVAGGDGSSPAADSKRVCHAALELAKKYNILPVLTSQLNMDAMRGGSDRLAKYQPPQVNHLWMPGVKTHVATGIVGLFRKVRDPLPSETKDDYVNTIKRARAGDLEPTEVLDPHVMGTVAMKLRNYGQHEGKRSFLAFERGRVAPLEARDQYTTDGGRLRKVI